VVQIHALDPHLILGNSPARNLEAINACGALTFTHPAQPALLRRMGVSLANKKALLRPIGALGIFHTRTAMSAEPTFAWVGRDTGANKRTAVFCDAIERLAAKADISAILVGENLEPHFERLAHTVWCSELRERRNTPIEDYPAIYQRCDAIVITSVQEAGPMCLYEALASGVPVVTTRCGWAEYLIQDGVNGYIVDDGKHLVDDIAHRLLDIASHRTEWFERRELIAASLMGWRLEGWIEDNVKLAMEIA
jgi:glycosyltransferase involved in cell wall biosynthesis